MRTAGKSPSSAARGAPEERICAAVASGRIQASRAPFYRQLAAKGDDLSVLDTLAAGVPDLGQLGAAEDPEDAVYRSLFGDTPASRSQPVSAAQASEDATYQRLFGSDAE